jgi:formylmethanofuran dehydrogenase subunit E
LQKKPVDTFISEEFLRRAIEFHGHLGPFLILGMKAGLTANSLLGKNCFEMTATVATEPRPPTSCFVDGVQFVTGCTMGKRNIKLRKSKGTSVVFMKEGKKVKLKVKEEVLKGIMRIASGEESDKESHRLLESPSSELFEATK